jgi:DNA-binding beta-propeller fold protein YncE
MKKFLPTVFSLIVLAACAHPGVGIVMDSKGNVYYTDLKQVWKIDTKGNKSVVVHHVHTHELYMDEQDNLYGEHLWYNGERLNTWGHYVWRYSADGKFEKIIPDTEGFLKNYSFVRDHHGNMFWADRGEDCQHVVKQDRNGIVTKLGPACFENIRWMTSTPSGTIYLIDLYDLKQINRWGQVKTLANDLHGRKPTQALADDQQLVMGLSVDAGENVYVAVYGSHTVKKVTPAGKVFIVAETNVSWSPTGVLSAPNGDLWILECSPMNAVRVERITKEGNRIIY